MASFNNRAGPRCRRSRGNRHIVCAVDGDIDRLIDEGTEVVGDTGGKRFVYRFAFLKRLGCSLTVVEAVGPNTSGSIDRNRTVGSGGRAGNSPNACGAAIHIGSSQVARNRTCASEVGAVVQISSF